MPEVERHPHQSIGGLWGVALFLSLPLRFQPEIDRAERRATITRLRETLSFLSARDRTAEMVRSSSVAISLASIPEMASERSRSSSSGVHCFDVCLMSASP